MATGGVVVWCSMGVIGETFLQESSDVEEESTVASLLGRRWAALAK